MTSSVKMLGLLFVASSGTNGTSDNTGYQYTNETTDNTVYQNQNDTSDNTNYQYQSDTTDNTGYQYQNVINDNIYYGPIFFDRMSTSRKYYITIHVCYIWITFAIQNKIRCYG